MQIDTDNIIITQQQANMYLLTMASCPRASVTMINTPWCRIFQKTSEVHLKSKAVRLEMRTWRLCSPSQPLPSNVRPTKTDKTNKFLPLNNHKAFARLKSFCIMDWTIYREYMEVQCLRGCSSKFNICTQTNTGALCRLCVTVWICQPSLIAWDLLLIPWNTSVYLVVLDSSRQCWWWKYFCINVIKYFDSTGIEFTG